MLNNFVNSFASIPTAGEFYQSTGSATDNVLNPTVSLQCKQWFKWC